MLTAPDQLPHPLTTGWAEVASAAMIFGSMLDLLPKICALIGAVYYVLLIYEWIVGKRWRNPRPHQRRHR